MTADDAPGASSGDACVKENSAGDLASPNHAADANPAFVAAAPAEADPPLPPAAASFAAQPGELQGTPAAPQGRLGFVGEWRLGFRRTCHSMAQVLGLRRLHDYLQGAGTELAPDNPVWLLGVEHKPKAPAPDAAEGSVTIEAQHEEAVRDFHSRMWFTYRQGFPRIGASTLTSDMGWGCTLRSGQMLLAEALSRHMRGRIWRLGTGSAQPAEEEKQILRWLHDSPAPESPFSVHNLCSAPGVSGVQAGEWLGPWVLCRALEVALNAARPLGVAAHVLAEPGGGAPTLYPETLEQAHFPAAGGAGGDGDGLPASALIVLLPLTLGIDKVNPRYVPQLRAVLTWPHSIGIVGGRPGSSLYFVGHQGENVLFLDPHETQQVVPDDEVGDAATYHCGTPRLMPLASIDPSLAIGFYCRTAESLRELCSQLAALEVKSAGAPLVSVTKGDAPAAADWQHESSSSPVSGAGGKGDEWELL